MELWSLATTKLLYFINSEKGEEATVDYWRMGGVAGGIRGWVEEGKKSGEEKGGRGEVGRRKGK